MSENKWWEYYAVRYIAGTVVGAGLVAFLNQRKDSPFCNSLSLLLTDLNIEGGTAVILFAAAGFAFCYVAAAPILTIHATRKHLRLLPNSKVVLLIGVAATATGLIVWQVAPARPCAVLTGALLVSVVGLQVVLLFYARTRFTDIESFYDALSKARAQATNNNNGKPQPQVQEYVESYRHLREHGNAFLILVMEGVLTFVLLNLSTIAAILVVLLVWILPACAAWLIATELEWRLTHKPPLDGQR